MKKSLLLLCVLAAAFSASATDAMKVKVVSAESRRPVADVTLSVEYPDTIVRYQTDRKGKLKFNPSSFPVTVTAQAPGMLDAVYGLMECPDGTLTIELSPDPSAPRPVVKRRVHWSSDRPRRLSSSYIVRVPADK